MNEKKPKVSEKDEWRFSVQGRFSERQSREELGLTKTKEKAERMVEAFKKWPALDPTSLRIFDKQKTKWL